MSVKTYLVALREERTLVATVEFDDELEEATPDLAKKRALDLRREGELRDAPVYDVTVEADGAWEPGADCVLEKSSFGDYFTCATHHYSTADPGKKRCFLVKEYEAVAAIG